MIANNGWRSVADVLANVPGLYLVDDGSLTSVGIRGVTGGLRGTRLIKIMINGVPVNFRPDVRAFIGPEYIPIDAIERIEVVKGLPPRRFYWRGGVPGHGQRDHA